MIKLFQSDITQLNIDAIVNAAIHRAAGPNLLDECRELKGCATGEAKITKGYNLPAKFVIHTVGPIWRGGRHNEAKLLAKCYQSSLMLAKKNNIKSIAFPNISTGVYGYPKASAANIAISTVQLFVKDYSLPNEIVFVVFDSENFESYKQILDL